MLEKSPDDLMLQEMIAMRKVVDYLYDGVPEAFNALYFIKGNYKQWPYILKWLKDNHLVGQRLVEFFKNASIDGEGYHMGVEHILSRLKGHKNSIEAVKIDELS